MRLPSKLLAATCLLTTILAGAHAAAAPERVAVAQKRLMAMRAAVADGYRQLAEIVNGVRVDSETTVKDFVVQSDVIRTQVSGMIKGARPGEPRYLSDGAVEVDVQLPLYGHGGVADAIDLERQVGKSRQSLLPTYDLGAVTPWQLAASGPYTGVVVDCRQVPLRPAMSPAILDEAGNELYVGSVRVEAEQVINDGVAAYRTDLNDALAAAPRVGQRPLVVQAKRAIGHFQADAVLGQADAETLRAADRAGNFLAQTRVVFVIRKP